MVLVIETTKENQVVNLGYNLGRWQETDKISKKYPTKGTVTWEEDSEPAAFNGNEGTSETGNNPLVHTYETVGEHKITIKGVIKWNKVSISSSNTSTPNSIREVLKSIEIPEGETSPIYYINTYAFYNCKKLEAILGNLFENCTEVTSFGSCFRNTQITAIPQGLFDKCTQAKDFSSCFMSTQITAILQGLFDKCTQAKDFSHCFQNTPITKIPEGLFDSCTQATYFEACFRVTQITAIPQGLFDQCTQATNFGYCFQSTQITAIPQGLFANNNAVTNFSYTFYNCSKVEGELPTLWKSHPDVTNHTQCFYNCTKANNYQEAKAAGWT